MDKYIKEMGNVKNVIEEVWKEIIMDIQENPKNYSSENTLVFKFAWKLKEKLNGTIKTIDFEKKITGLKNEYTDLYVEYKKRKIGFEFKFPKNSNGTTNQTKTRINIINDIKRLNKLVCDAKIDYGVFLLATDEASYINEGNKRIATNFKTHDGHKYKKGEAMLSEAGNIFEAGNKLSNDICFKWNNFETKTKRVTIKENIAWIDPIFLYNNNKNNGNT